MQCMRRCNIIQMLTGFLELYAAPVSSRKLSVANETADAHFVLFNQNLMKQRDERRTRFATTGALQTCSHSEHLVAYFKVLELHACLSLMNAAVERSTILCDRK